MIVSTKLTSLPEVILPEGRIQVASPSRLSSARSGAAVGQSAPHLLSSAHPSIASSGAHQQDRSNHCNLAFKFKHRYLVTLQKEYTGKGAFHLTESI